MPEESRRRVDSEEWSGLGEKSQSQRGRGQHGPPQGPRGRRYRCGPSEVAGAARVRGVKRGEKLTKEEVLSLLQDKVAKWWLPDDVVFLEEIPKPSVGKFAEKELRAKDYKLPTELE